MQEPNLFERAEAGIRRNTNRALLLMFIGLVGIFLIFYMGGRSEAERQKLQSLSGSKGKLVHADLIWADLAFAESKSPRRYYHFGQLEDYSLVVVSLQQQTHDRLTGMILADPKLLNLMAEPFIVNGMVDATSLNLRGYISEAFASYKLEGDLSLGLTDTRLLYMVAEGSKPFSFQWPTLLLLPGVVGLIMLLVGIGNKRALRRSRERIQELQPPLEDLSAIDRDAQLSIPTLKLKLYEPLLIGEGGKLSVSDLRQTGWIYRHTVRSRYGVQSYLRVHGLDKRVAMIPLVAKPKQVEAELDALWRYLAEHHPDIQLGFGKEQEAQFKNRLQG